MKAYTKGIVLLLIAASLAGCSRKKNTFLNRNWHAVTTQYNTLYNGNLALDLGKEEMKAEYFDNYWDILPIERMQVIEEVILPEDSKNPNFQKAEEKAVKAIQRHSMLIKEKEKNPQIDEAYLLLGKARYFDQRFVPALEAFNYILHKYPFSNTINQAKIWREKTNMRLEFNELAILNLKNILKQESLKKQDRADASATLAQAYINLSSKDSAIAPLKLAAKFTKNNEEKGRYSFIKGQLYNSLGMKDSANMAFEEVIDLNRKSPRIYMINAYIAKIQNANATAKDRKAILELLTDLEQDRENRDFLDKIYFQLAEYHYQIDSVQLAVDYYNKSLQSRSQDYYLQSLDYQSLGNINFDAANFETAGAYYDSTMMRLPKNSRDFRIIKKKRDNLEEVIFYENISRKNDSILYLTDLSEEERLEYFTTYTDKLKAEAKTAAEANIEENPAMGYFENKRTGMPGVPNPGNAFYFYNPTTVEFGKQEFERIWGERGLADNWRSQENRSAPQDNEAVTKAEEIDYENNPVFSPLTYINLIPEDPQILDSLQNERNFAYYQLGILYKEKFMEYPLAADKFNLLLESDPEERLILPAKYHLFRTYEEMGQDKEAETIKTAILQVAPNSRYAAILQNPEEMIQDDNSPEMLYKNVYGLYEEQEFEEVIQKSDQLTNQFTGEKIVPKFELLKAMAIGRLMGYVAYKKALNEVALTYPQSEEGKKAEELQAQALPALAKYKYREDNFQDSYKLIFPREKTNISEAKELQDKIKNVLEQQNNKELEVTLDVYDPQQIFVVVHGFSSSQRSLSFAESLLSSKEHEIQKNSFYISSHNYQVAQIHKNIETYLKTINKTPK